MGSCLGAGLEFEIIIVGDAGELDAVVLVEDVLVGEAARGAVGLRDLLLAHGRLHRGFLGTVFGCMGSCLGAGPEYEVVVVEDAGEDVDAIDSCIFFFFWFLA